jgi:hypothetical protein
MSLASCSFRTRICSKTDFRSDVATPLSNCSPKSRTCNHNREGRNSVRSANTSNLPWSRRLAPGPPRGGDAYRDCYGVSLIKVRGSSGAPCSSNAGHRAVNEASLQPVRSRSIASIVLMRRFAILTVNRARPDRRFPHVKGSGVEVSGFLRSAVGWSATLARSTNPVRTAHVLGSEERLYPTQLVGQGAPARLGG